MSASEEQEIMRQAYRRYEQQMARLRRAIEEPRTDRKPPETAPERPQSD